MRIRSNRSKGALIVIDLKNGGQYVFTPFKTFGKKQLKKVIDDKAVIVYNLFGFGFWICSKNYNVF